MSLATQPLNEISHPLVSSMHMKKDFSKGHDVEYVLVIDAILPDAKESSEAFDASLTDLLLDLEDLKEMAETRVGKFDRVDIRSHYH
ncbi:MAG: hypothetical protein GC136_00865 [Alphaproteobacteria bacterium]|nr:hypothetical protein [Alphaproteobacteria bacterium]